MNQKGIPEEELLAELSSFSNADTNFKKVFSSMCTIPHPIAVAAQQKFSLSNIGDPGLFRGTRKMEAEIIRMAASFLNHPDPRTAFGHLTSGGTESNIEAVLHMKNRFLALNSGIFSEKSQKSQERKTSANHSAGDFPHLNLIVPKTAHFSFEKIANLLDIRLKKADINSHFQVIPESAESLIDESTIGLIGIAGNTEFGACDPISALSDLALKYRLPLHVDAAFGGFIYPFLEQSRPAGGTKFSFDLPGVTSVSLDPHKTGFSVIPSGILIFRDESVVSASLEKIRVKTPYLTSKYQSTLSGTRAGSSVAATYAVIKHLGAEGYRQNVKYCMELADHFQSELRKIGLKPAVVPQINILALRVTPESSFKNEDDEKKAFQKVETLRLLLLEKFGWNVSATQNIPALRFVLMPHNTKQDITDMIADLKKLLDAENKE